VSEVRTALSSIYKVSRGGSSGLCQTHIGPRAETCTMPTANPTRQYQAARLLPDSHWTPNYTRGIFRLVLLIRHFDIRLNFSIFSRSFIFVFLAFVFVLLAI
jgi:hypothetical protein